MIPLFPDFKKLELSDQKDIEAITSKYPPYSDFDFAVMWSWDTNSSVKISRIDGNLILLARNIYNGNIVCTFIGNDNINNTLKLLFGYLDDLNLYQPRICLVPEHALKGLDFHKYFIEIDLNSCDYMYDLNMLVTYAGNQYEQKRGRANSFLKNYSHCIVSPIDLNDQKVLDDIFNLNDAWAVNGNKYRGAQDSANQEPIALRRFLDSHFDNLKCLAIYNGTQMIGYALFTGRDGGVVINHFIKADILYKGVYEYFMKECARSLVGNGFKYMNYQEDMGIAGLRQAKMAYRPIKFLKKYFIGQL